MQFEKTYTREFFKDFKLHSSFGLVQFCRIVFKKLTGACFFQIALQTILLPIQTVNFVFICTLHRCLHYGVNMNFAATQQYLFVIRKFHPQKFQIQNRVGSIVFLNNYAKPSLASSRKQRASTKKNKEHC